ncbi:MAG: prephenate dehydrogenase/arogenate dehydrogenase family protein [Ruminococcus sp.]|nr:prephenate dehydrogenase/arogenate dehydrogenase family protein [Ruminococcus sp.]
MKIGVVGLGLIGGSIAKSIKKNTSHVCFGYDIDRAATAGALAQEAIDDELTAENITACDIIIVCLHPKQTIDYIVDNADVFGKNTILIDTCGVKREIVSAVDDVCAEKGIAFVGCHPMAGREFSGFAYSVDNLFERASFIITTTEKTQIGAVSKVSSLAKEMGFARVVISTPEEHDKVIAFTSQLAHIVSSSYVKSPSLLKQSGFSAGSFKDLTRVAKLNEDMWTELFLMNREPLTDEIDHIIARLTEYRDAISGSDADKLRSLLRDGRELKELSNNTI